MIYRTYKNKSNPYVQINRTVLNDKRLSWKAKGILSYCLSMPDAWEFYLEELETHSTDGMKGLRAGINELRDNGYLKRKPEYKNGKIFRWVTDIYEQPQAELIKLCKPCGQRASTTLPFCTSRKPTSRKRHANNNEAKTKTEAISNKTIVKAQDVELKRNKLIVTALNKLVTRNIIQAEDIERLAKEIACHIDHRPPEMSEQHSLNAAIALIRKGVWSTPKSMLARDSEALETKWAIEKQAERQELVNSKLGKLLAKQMRGVDG